MSESILSVSFMSGSISCLRFLRSDDVACVVLQDAAERDRLGGSTFRVLTKWLSWMRYLFMAYAAANMLNAAHVWMQG
jgi:hypothetical protein